jgi:hypothetical protein
LHKNTQVGGEIKMNAVNQQPATNNQQPAPRYQCRHIFTDGHRCGSICLRNEPFCYYHHTTRKPAPRQSLGKKSSFDLPLPEDRSAIQASIGIILQKIASNDLDPRRAGLLLYGLQIASLNLPKQQRDQDEDAPEQVQEITTHPTLGDLAPESEIHEQKSFAAQLLEELRPKPAILPQIQATADTSMEARSGTPKLVVVRRWFLESRDASPTLATMKPSRRWGTQLLRSGGRWGGFGEDLHGVLDGVVEAPGGGDDDDRPRCRN